MAMTFFQLATVLMVISAVFAYLNYRYLRLPMPIGVMALALAFSLALVGAGELGEIGGALKQGASRILDRIDFNEAVLHGMLAFLLFAGALHIDLAELREQKLPVGLLATAGVLISGFAIAGLVWMGLGAIGMPLPFIWCLLFGALISPTDPIAVLATMKRAGAPAPLETKISAESLFNDGTGVVFFLVLLEIERGGGELHASGVAWLFLKEAAGGALLGLASGLLAFIMLRRVNQYQVEILLTVALAMGAYVLAERMHVSAPITVVVAGLLVGNHGRALAMSEQTRRYLDMFWELIDSILNVVLFVLIGLEVLVMPLGWSFVLAGLLAIPCAVAARWLSVTMILGSLSALRRSTPGAIAILTWGGLRGGISVAMALSLASSAARERVLVMTYGVVLFSILVQGLTIEKVVRRRALRGRQAEA